MSTDLLADALARQETIIERGLTSFLEVGDALQTIRSDRLYLLTHPTFSDYCLDRWGFSDARARQLVLAAKAVTNVTAAGLTPPANEGQARELARVPEPQRADVWRETLERTDGQPTAAAVREVAAVSASAPVEPPAAEPEPVPKPRTAEQIDRARRRETAKAGHRAAERIVSALRVDAAALVAAVELGETDLITADLVADVRAVLAALEAQL